MSSGEPASSSPAGIPPRLNPGSGRTIVWAAVAIAALAAFAFWLNFPQPHFVPAPFDPVGPDCPKTSRVFVPTNATEVPDLPSSDVPPKERDRMIFRANMEACPCGCQLSLAACRMNYAACTRSAEQLKKVVAEALEKSSPAR
jgi:hypothetical protein